MKKIAESDMYIYCCENIYVDVVLINQLSASMKPASTKD